MVPDGEISDLPPRAVNVAVVHNGGSQSGSDADGIRILLAGVPVNPVKKLVLDSMHDGIVSGVAE